MLRRTLSNAVMEALCDTTLFRPNNTYTVRDVTDIIQTSLYLKDVPVIHGLSGVVRRNLNKISGYKRRSNSKYVPPRKVIYNINPQYNQKPTRWGYTIDYTFYDKT